MARTPVIDRLAAEGINYRRAYNQNTVCMPARSTMLTGQYVRTHGVVANGIPLPDRRPVDRGLSRGDGRLPHGAAGQGPLRAGLRPAPPFRGERPGGPWRHRPVARLRALRAGHARGRVQRAPHRALRPVAQEEPSRAPGELRRAAAGRAGRRHARPRDQEQPDPAGVVPHGLGGRPDRRLAPLAGRRTSRGSAGCRSPTRTIPGTPRPPSSPGCPGRSWTSRPATPARRRRSAGVLARKPAHWLAFWDGSFPNMEGGPAAFVPSKLTPDQIREVNAKVHVMNELIDEACGRVLATVAARGELDHTDVVFTTDHGELQGDFGLLYKGPYHTDALMRLPFVWRPAPSAGIAPAVVERPGGPGRPGADVLRHRRRGPGALHAGAGPADGRRRARPRARPVRVGQPVPGLRHAPALGLPRRVAVHRVRAVDGRAAQRAGGDLGRQRARGPARSSTSSRPAVRAGSASPPASSTASTRTRTSSRTCGTTPPTPPSATTWWPTSTPACPTRCGTSRWWRRRRAGTSGQAKPGSTASRKRLGASTIG